MRSGSTHKTTTTSRTTAATASVVLESAEEVATAGAPVSPAVWPSETVPISPSGGDRGGNGDGDGDGDGGDADGGDAGGGDETGGGATGTGGGDAVIGEGAGMPLETSVTGTPRLLERASVPIVSIVACAAVASAGVLKLVVTTTTTEPWDTLTIWTAEGSTPCSAATRAANAVLSKSSMF